TDRLHGGDSRLPVSDRADSRSSPPAVFRTPALLSGSFAVRDLRGRAARNQRANSIRHAAGSHPPLLFDSLSARLGLSGRSARSRAFPVPSDVAAFCDSAILLPGSLAVLRGAFRLRHGTCIHPAATHCRTCRATERSARDVMACRRRRPRRTSFGVAMCASRLRDLEVFDGSTRTAVLPMASHDLDPGFGAPAAAG